jgi:hypothetical protein
MKDEYLLYEDTNSEQNIKPNVNVLYPQKYHTHVLVGLRLEFMNWKASFALPRSFQVDSVTQSLRLKREISLQARPPPAGVTPSCVGIRECDFQPHK